MDWVPLVEMAHLVNSIRTRSALVSMMMVSSFTYHAADGGDLIAHRQLRAHLGRRLFLLVLRPGEQEIEDRDQDHERQKHAQ